MLKAASINNVEYERLCNSNVTSMYCLIGLTTLYQSICCWNVFDAYISILAKAGGSERSNTWVGCAESVTGIAQLLFAVPSGYLSDVIYRDTLTTTAGYLILITSASAAVAFYHDNWIMIYLNMGLFGIFTSITATAAEAVFTDSCDISTRPQKINTKGMCQSIGLGMGPLIMMGVFYFRGNNWSINTLHFPLIIGCLCGPLAAIPCFNLVDTRRFNVQNEDLNEPLTDKKPVQGNRLSVQDALVKVGQGIGSYKLNRGSLASYTCDNIDKGRSIEAVADQIEQMEKTRFSAFSPMQKKVPYILALADFVTEIGAGMTVRFFPLFFINDYDVSPIMLNFIFAVQPIVVTLAILFCGKVSMYIGRTQVSFVFQVMGIFSLLLMVVLDDLTILIILFFLRGAFQNGAYPIDRSVLMDFTKSAQRGRWSSIISLTTMTWSGSAVVGGLITDSHDYRYTFLITSIIYSVGVAIYSPLVCLVTR